MNGILILSGCQYDEFFAKRLGSRIDERYKNDPKVRVLHVVSRVPSCFRPSDPFENFDEELFKKFMSDTAIEPVIGYERGMPFYQYIRRRFKPVFLIDLHDGADCSSCNMAKDSCDKLAEGEPKYHIGVATWNLSRYNRSPRNRQLLLKCADILKPFQIVDEGRQGLLTLHYGTHFEFPPDPDDGEITIELEPTRNKTSELETLNTAEKLIDTLITQAKALWIL